MTYEIKKFEDLLGLGGFSDTLLKNHFSLYEGYVKNVNSIISLFPTLEINSPEYNEIHRRLGWEWNGMRMHELYFENLTKNYSALNSDSLLYKDLVKYFESYDKWLADFKALGLLRGIGWVALVKDNQTGDMMNIWVGEHDQGQLAGVKVLLVMDVWEHAYMTDYGIKRADYIEKFIQAINWPVVEKRN
jgi:Fe-Mn family superoxide dismutase